MPIGSGSGTAPGRRGSLAAGVVVLLLFLAALGIYGRGALAARQFYPGRAGDQLGADPKAVVQPDGRRAALARTMLLGDPLDQRALNALMVQRSRVAGRPVPVRDTALALRLGWRDTVTLQNALLGFARAEQLVPLVDTLDALLRREQIQEQVGAALMLFEPYPAYRRILVQRLASGPPWRRYYLLTTAERLATPVAVAARHALLLDLRASSRPPALEETASVLPGLTRFGRAPQALALWQATAGRIARPLADPGFDRIAAAGDKTVLSAFDWQLAIGEGLRVSAGGQPTALSIQWNGVGVPVFASQQTSAMPGVYRLRATLLPGADGAVDALGFRAVCPTGATGFQQLGPLHDGAVDYLGAVRCPFPRLELFGNVRDRPIDVNLALDSVALTPFALPAGALAAGRAGARLPR